MLHYQRGQVYNALKQYAEAEDDFALAFQRNPDYPNLLYSWAWQLATCPDPQFRDGEKALEYARKAAEKSQGKNPDCTDTLAAAYAEVGQFDEARKWQEKALREDQQARLPDMLRELLRQPEFRTRARRMGKVTRISTIRIDYWQFPAQPLKRIAWRTRWRRKG